MSQAVDPIAVVAPSTLATRSITRAATSVFWLMWLMNFLNYVDRWAFTVVSPNIKAEFHLSDGQVGLLATAFLLTYTLGILPLGLLADRVKRTFVVSGGVAFWSVATVLTALIPGFAPLFITRAALGLGEGSYYPAGTSLLSSYYAQKDRARIMSRWGVGSMVGIATGFVLGGIIADAFGWRAAFFFFGPPGFILALLMLFAKEPPRQASDEASPELALARQGTSGIWNDIVRLSRIHTLRVTVAVQALGFFVITASVVFLPILLKSQFHISTGKIGIISGAVIVLGGVIGILLGGVLADRLVARFPGARVLVGGWGFLLATPFFIGAVLSAVAFPGIDSTVRLYGMFAPFFLITAILMNIYSGPLTAAVQDVTSPAMRAAAVGLTLMFSHLLGDLFSPYIVGTVGDALNAHSTAPLLHTLGVTPDNALGASLLLFCVPLLIIAGIVGIRGAGAVVRDAQSIAAA